MGIVPISKIKESVEKVAKEYGLKRVSLFGSYANGTRTKKSDIDLLVELPEKTPQGRSVTLFTLIKMQHQLEDLTGKSVDMVSAPIPEHSFVKIEKVVQLYEE